MLAKDNRLRSHRDYGRVFKKGQTYFSPFFNLGVLFSKLNKSRFGVIISANISKKATIRNLFKRRINSIIQKNINNLETGLDLTIKVKPAALNLEYSGLEHSLTSLFYYAGVLKNKSK
ncbi:MAG: Ribonuclease P protein component [Candidatus Kuenenbacteria bacterium GW2011_GWA2_42_15]|uniref:Ribonuclease P protein component n=2 Tax=Patescibacteria group TaxID=1783273 RepID=A0A0G0YT09_9BACT|nr:MAG: Ribonuclease P protein component [Candidatus Daviesbacteria bacterium GW2011_GWF2_38_6]KKS39767.1 MAG: Ribonuclease P protein component [Candidatus Kuenenbacteria bacterium GW2011_GWA2_42_15]